MIKSRKYYLLSATDIPIPKTWVIWWRKQANEFINSTKYPLVLKLSSDITSRNVVLVRNAREARRFAKALLNAGMHMLPATKSPFGFIAQRLREAAGSFSPKKITKNFIKAICYFRNSCQGMNLIFASL